MDTFLQLLLATAATQWGGKELERFGQGSRQLASVRALSDRKQISNDRAREGSGGHGAGLPSVPAGGGSPAGAGRSAVQEALVDGAGGAEPRRPRQP